MQQIDGDAIRTRTSEYRLLPSGVLHQSVVVDGARITIEDARQAQEAIDHFAVHGTVYLMADARRLAGATKEARDYGRQPQFTQRVGAMAIIVGGSVSRVIGGFYMAFTKPPYPTRLFTDLESAEAWLLEQMS